MNLMEIMRNTFKPFLDGEKKPVNVGEVGNLWLFLGGAEQFLREEQAALNVVQDEELKEKLVDVIENVQKPMIVELREFLADVGVASPVTLPEKPRVEFTEIPEAAKLSDNEIANLIANNLTLGITYAARGLSESVRADVSWMFAKFQMRKIMFALTFKPLMEEKGWLRVPPAFR